MPGFHCSCTSCSNENPEKLEINSQVYRKNIIIHYYVNIETTAFLFQNSFFQNVLGEVFEVDEKALKWLHDFEDVGNWYDCIEIDTVSLEGNIGTKCFCYVKHGDTAELLKQDHYEVYSLELANTYIPGFVKGNKF